MFGMCALRLPKTRAGGSEIRSLARIFHTPYAANRASLDSSAAFSKSVLKG